MFWAKAENISSLEQMGIQVSGIKMDQSTLDFPFS